MYVCIYDVYKCLRASVGCLCFTSGTNILSAFCQPFVIPVAVVVAVVVLNSTKSFLLPK